VIKIKLSSTGIYIRLNLQRYFENKLIYSYVGFKVFTAVTMKNDTFTLFIIIELQCSSREIWGRKECQVFFSEHFVFPLPIIISSMLYIRPSSSVRTVDPFENSTLK
jgi:hypothetical protein